MRVILYCTIEVNEYLDYSPKAVIKSCLAKGFEIACIASDTCATGTYEDFPVMKLSSAITDYPGLSVVMTALSPYENYWNTMIQIGLGRLPPYRVLNMDEIRKLKPVDSATEVRCGFDKTLPVVMYGAGERSALYIGELICMGLRPVCLCDRDKKKHGKLIGIFPVRAIEDVCDELGDAFNIIISAAKVKTVRDYLTDKHGVNQARIINANFYEILYDNIIIKKGSVN